MTTTIISEDWPFPLLQTLFNIFFYRASSDAVSSQGECSRGFLFWGILSGSYPNNNTVYRRLSVSRISQAAMLPGVTYVWRRFSKRNALPWGIILSQRNPREIIFRSCQTTTTMQSEITLVHQGFLQATVMAGVALVLREFFRLFHACNAE